MVTFNVARVTRPGESVWVVGNVTELGGWDVSGGVEMKAGAYREGYPRWWASVEFAAGGEGVAYKYYQKEANGGGAFEGGGNREVSLEGAGGCGRGGRGGVVVDVWQN